MSKFRKKPIVIEAWQLPRDVAERDVAKAPQFLLDAMMRGTVKFFETDDGDRTVEPPPLLGLRTVALIETLEGVMRAEVGDWIIRGVKGELYPCKPDIFEATYDPA